MQRPPRTVVSVGLLSTVSVSSKNGDAGGDALWAAGNDLTDKFGDHCARLPNADSDAEPDAKGELRT